MPGMFAVYYDFAAYVRFEDRKDILVLSRAFPDFIDWDDVRRRIETREFFGYSGIMNPDDGDSNDVRLSSIPKGEKPVFLMSFNKDAYTRHCREYGDYQEWVKRRNPVRYESNLGHNYDSKNMMHCMRLVRMAKELALGQGFNVVRDKDREYLLDIRNHQFEYDDIMRQLDEEKAEMEQAIQKCTLPEHVDYNYINQLLIETRKKIYQI